MLAASEGEVGVLWNHFMQNPMGNWLPSHQRSGRRFRGQFQHWHYGDLATALQHQRFGVVRTMVVQIGNLVVDKLVNDGQ